jgi:hypothetical protein
MKEQKYKESMRYVESVIERLGNGWKNQRRRNPYVEEDDIRKVF